MEILVFIILSFSMCGFFVYWTKRMRKQMMNEQIEFIEEMGGEVCSIIEEDSKKRQKDFDVIMKHLKDNEKKLNEIEDFSSKYINDILGTMLMMNESHNKEVQQLKKNIDVILNPEKYKPKPPNPKALIKIYANKDINKELATNVVSNMHPLDKRQLFKKFFIQTTTS